MVKAKFTKFDLGAGKVKGHKIMPSERSSQGLWNSECTINNTSENIPNVEFFLTEGQTYWPIS